MSTIIGEAADLLAEFNTLAANVASLGEKVFALVEKIGKEGAEIPDVKTLAANAADLKAKVAALKAARAAQEAEGQKVAE